MTRFAQLHEKLTEGMDMPGLSLPVTAVKLFHKNDTVPASVLAYHDTSDTPTACEAAKGSMEGAPLYLTLENIGCVAAAITFGFVDQDEDQPLDGPRAYTEIMRQQSGKGDEFVAPAPKDFTSGDVYAFRDVGKPEYALFGKDDAGRFNSVKQAREAVSEMMVIQPAVMQGVFFYPPQWDEADIEPDIVILSVRPVEMLRLVQAYQFLSGKRVKADMGPLRAVDSDLIVRPLLTGEINISAYCLGGRIIGQFEPDRLGMGVPYAVYKMMAEGMDTSRTGYPFPKYPGAEHACSGCKGDSSCNSHGGCSRQ